MRLSSVTTAYQSLVCVNATGIVPFGTVTMIGGVLIIIALLVIRLNDDAVSLPASVTLPNGTKPVAFTQTKDWYAVVTEDNRILIFDLNGELSQTMRVEN